MRAVISKRFGCFEIIEKLGCGGMASVYKASYSPLERIPANEALDRLTEQDVVALKIADAQLLDEPIIAQRFRNEYRIMRQLNHPHLVRALGYGQEEEMPFLVLEYVPGQSLDKRLKRSGPLPVDEAVALVREIAQAVAFIHGNNLVHRDIHPGNILINPGGNAKLTDLGLMKDLESPSLLTNSGVGLGTLGYAAPEQFDDARNADHRCDIYGLAATLYFALTGIFPFGAGSFMQVMKRKLEHRLVPLSRLISGTSLALDQVVLRALHPDPAVRPASIEELIDGICGKVSTQPIPIPGILSARPSPVGQGRRSHVRHSIQLFTTLHHKSALTDELLPVSIQDVSHGGLCLQISRSFEIDALLQVSLPNEYAGCEGLSSSYLVRARWVRKHPVGGWLLGCSFVRPLEELDLDRFLSLARIKTQFFSEDSRENGKE